jgi:hypothetical protein
MAASCGSALIRRGIGHEVRVDLAQIVRAAQSPQAIAVSEDHVVGYCLSLPLSLQEELPGLAPMFEQFRRCAHRGSAFRQPLLRRRAGVWTGSIGATVSWPACTSSSGCRSGMLMICVSQRLPRATACRSELTREWGSRSSPPIRTLAKSGSSSPGISHARQRSAKVPHDESPA